MAAATRRRRTRGSGLEPIEAATPVAPWRGGKRLMAKRIIARLEAIPHRCYAEPFAGMGGVFFRRKQRPKSEILNDRNGEIVNLFRIVREHPDELTRQFEWALSSRSEFVRMLSSPPEILTDVQRAARFAFLQRMTFRGEPAHEVTAGGTGASVGRQASFTAARMRRLIGAAHRRLQGVHVECLDWAAFIPRYDRPTTLFYVDPPYWGHEADYGKGLFAREDFARLAELLRGIRGRFLLSLNDRPEVRKLFAGCKIERARVPHTLGTQAGRKVQPASELLISNVARDAK